MLASKVKMILSGDGGVETRSGSLIPRVKSI